MRNMIIQNAAIKVMRHLLSAPLLLLVLCFSAKVFAAVADTRQVIMIVGYDGRYWYPYTAVLESNIKHRDWEKITAIENPVAVTRQPQTGHFFVKEDNGEVVQWLRQNDKLESKPLPALDSTQLSYTHLRAHNGGLLAVKLIQGKSRETELTNFDSQLNKVSSVVKQASAQFHPLQINNTLFYSHVSCRLACSPVIQEVWQRDMVSNKTRQLTLFNATTYLHSVDNNKKFAYINSNVSGYYQLGRLNLMTGENQWLTQGQVTHSYPSIANNGSLYFIRRDYQGATLSVLPNASKIILDESQLKTIALPKSVTKIRYLEITEQ